MRKEALRKILWPTVLLGWGGGAAEDRLADVQIGRFFAWRWQLRWTAAGSEALVVLRDGQILAFGTVSWESRKELGFRFERLAPSLDVAPILGEEHAAALQAIGKGFFRGKFNVVRIWPGVERPLTEGWYAAARDLAIARLPGWEGAAP